MCLSPEDPLHPAIYEGAFEDLLQAAARDRLAFECLAVGLAETGDLALGGSALHPQGTGEVPVG